MKIPKIMGRPKAFKSPAQLLGKINKYFQDCFEEDWYRTEQGQVMPRLDREGETIHKQVKPFTVIGMCNYLGITRETLRDYGTKPDFSDIIKRTKLVIEQYKQECLYDKDRKNVTGIIFDLKVNNAWKTDTQDTTKEDKIDAYFNLLEEALLNEYGPK